MDAYPDMRERNMARWALMGGLGDLAAPTLFVALAFVSAGWRAAFFVCGGLVAIWAVGLAFVRFPSDSSPPRRDESEPLRKALRAAVTERGLGLWLTGSWLCFLLDEVLVAFGALYMRDVLVYDDAARNSVLAAFALGSIVGLLVTDRTLTRYRPRSLLAFASAGCLLAYAAWLAAGTPLTSALSMLMVGGFTGPQYAIAQAQAYRALPDRSGLVNAFGHLLMPLTLLAPLGIGLVSDRFGLETALLLLAIQPLGLLAIALRSKRIRMQEK
jgi:predicted MFS family arabinose efflux permease